jgi:malonate-semialdehyde dehydrogenase (acetylating) / methylmalonate-semialdehyde dehydrogenase
MFPIVFKFGKLKPFDRNRIGMTLRAYQTYSTLELDKLGFKDVPRVPLFINGEFVQSKTNEWLPVHNPANQQLLCLVPQATPEELAHACKVASDAFKSWKNASIVSRQQKMFELQKLIKANMVGN